MTTAARRAVAHYLMGIVFTAVTVVTGLWASPLIKNGLGVESFGAARMLLDWYGQLGILDVGLGAALSAWLARVLGRGDALAASTAVRVGVRLFARVAVATLVVGGGLALVMHRLVPVSSSAVDDLRAGWWILVVAGALTWFAAPFRCVVEAAQRGFLINGLLTVQAVVIACLGVWLARRGGGIAGQAGAVALGTCGFALSAWWLGRRLVSRLGGEFAVERDLANLPSSSTSTSTSTSTALGEEAYPSLARQGGAALVLSLAARVGPLTDSLLIGGLVGPAAAASWFFTSRLAVLAQGQLLMVGNASWAALAGLHARGEREVLEARLVELTELVVVLGMAASAAIVVGGESFVVWWAGREVWAGAWLLGLTVLAAVFQAILSLWSWCFTGAGRPDQVARPALAQAVLALGLGVLFLVFGAGMLGPVLGSLTAMLAVGAWTSPWLLRRWFGVRPRLLYIAVARPLFWGIVYSGVVLVISGLMSEEWLARWWVFLPMMVIVALGYLVLAAFVVFSVERRVVWARRLGWRGG